MSKLFEQLLKIRGLDSSFLQLKYEDLTDPFVLPDMDKVVDRIKTAVEQHEKILIYGDYDVDGVTASTVMEDTLKLAGVKSENIEIMLPNRFTDGYGMSKRLVDHAKKQGVNLVITVDCGSNSHEIVEGLNLLNIDTIITDHHETSDTFPSAVAILNPKRKDFVPINGLNHLAGVGVAFKVAQALRDRELIPNGQEKWLLDLVLIGTICDTMLLTGENRILCSFGFKVLAKTRRPGLKELIRLARVNKLNSESIGFRIGPRLNAAGRLKSADLSLGLLRCTSNAEAAALASELEELNKKRKTEQLAAIDEIRTHLGSSATNENVIVEVGKWHEGVLGIIAGRVVEDYRRPTFVLSEVGEGVLKGSGRSFGDFNLAEALKTVKDLLLTGGGHAYAAGISLTKTNLPAFKESINKYYQTLGLKDQTNYLKTTPDLTVNDFSGLTLDFLDELKTLEPFGLGNEEPVFRLTDIEIIKVTAMGTEKDHLRLDVKDKAGRSIKSIRFFAPDKWLALTPEHKVDLVVKLAENDFNGIKSIEAQICDIIFL